ncbi:MAG: sodium ion-translocating decarboxylase subunit beta [bacterium]|nr:sodium ion-translocating decarboxylase subunit beta [bacterium]
MLGMVIVKTGFVGLTWKSILMILVGFIFCYLAIVKEYEPYELLPIGLGAILVNLPFHQMCNYDTIMTQNSGLLGIAKEVGLFTYNLLPPLIFLGLGAITDFSPLIANPKMLLLGGAAQVGVFVAFFLSIMWGFPINDAAAISIIGGADGPTTIYINAILAPHNLGVTAVTAYSYMGLVAIIQPPIMRLLTTKEERLIRMEQLRPVSQRTKILFPFSVMILSILLIPMSAPLVSMFMIGNIFRESGVVERLSKSAANELINVVTIFLMLCIGITLEGEKVCEWNTFKILIMGLVAFAAGTAGGLLFAKTMNLVSKHKINPLIGAAGVSAVPMAARVAQEVAHQEDHDNHILMHAMGPNVAGVIGSAIVAGYFLSVLKP